MEKRNTNSDPDTKKPAGGSLQSLLKMLGFTGEKIEITAVTAAELEKKIRRFRFQQVPRIPTDWWMFRNFLRPKPAQKDQLLIRAYGNGGSLLLP